LKTPLVLILCALALTAAAQDAPPTRSLAMEAVSGQGPLTASPSQDSTAPVPPAPLNAAAIDSSDLKQLPPRALPLKKQMMFAGGFMVCVALMLTSMQNFNPND